MAQSGALLFAFAEMLVEEVAILVIVVYFTPLAPIILIDLHSFRVAEYNVSARLFSRDGVGGV